MVCNSGVYGRTEDGLQLKFNIFDNVKTRLQHRKLTKCTEILLFFKSKLLETVFTSANLASKLVPIKLYKFISRY